MPTIYDETNSYFTTGDYWFGPTGITPITVTANGAVINTAGTSGYAFGNDGLHFPGGAYTVTVNGVVGTSVFLADAPSADGIEFSGPGTSKLTVGATGIIFGQVGVFGLQAVNITNNGSIRGTFAGIYQAGAGNYAITNTEDVVAQTFGLYLTGSGIHTIVNSGIIQATSDGAFDPRGIWATGANGVEKITNSGTIIGRVDLGSDNDSLTNSGVISSATGLAVDMGAGNDVFTNTGRTTGSIEMGSGNDTFTGGSSAETVFDNFGKDTYKLGAGDDQFYATGFNDGLLDTVDGGTNSTFNFNAGLIGDIYDARLSSSGVFINMDTAAKIDVFGGGTSYAAKTAFGSDIGTDTVSNFETIYGSNSADVIFGNASANYIHGFGGNDHIYGGAGNDYLFGGGGSNELIGGAGRDVIDVGGAASADFIDYFLLSDSTALAKGRDLILGFQDGLDHIDFSRIGLVATSFAGVDQYFTKSAGQTSIRVLTTGDGWTVQLDRNGDAKVDMAVDVQDTTHTINWSLADFFV